MIGMVTVWVTVTGTATAKLTATIAATVPLRVTARPDCDGDEVRTGSRDGRDLLI